MQRNSCDLTENHHTLVCLQRITLTLQQTQNLVQQCDNLSFVSYYFADCYHTIFCLAVNKGNDTQFEYSNNGLIVASVSSAGDWVV